MHELERLITAARKRMKTESLCVRGDSSGWNITKSGPSQEDLFRATFAQVLARLREWAGEPEPEPEPMTVAELMALRDRAASVTGGCIAVMIAEHATLSRGGVGGYACHTMEQVVAKLREWATPPLPEVTTLENVPVSWVQARVSEKGRISGADTEKVDEICRATMAKLQSTQHT